MEEVEHIKITGKETTKELVEKMSKTGFTARKIGLASKLAEDIFNQDCTIFLGIAGAMVPAGMKQIIIDLLNTNKIKVFVTTGANLTHDLIEALGHKHYHCDTWNDEEFNEKGYDRIYNVLMKNNVYEDLEDFFEKNWKEIKKATNIKEFLKILGSLLPENSNSILRTCFDKNIDLYCPAIQDSGIGLMVWGRKASGKSISVDAFEDLKEIIDTAWTAKRKAVIYVGGGVPKNYIQQALQFSSGADYGIQITTDRESSGGSSGAPLEEGKSWGKLKPKAHHIDVRCDATLALPLIFSSVLNTPE